MKIVLFATLLGATVLISACQSTRPELTLMTATSSQFATPLTLKDRNSFFLAIGSDKTQLVRGGKSIQAYGRTYHLGTDFITAADVRTAFVAKTIKDEPALGLRFHPAAEKRLRHTLRQLTSATVLASVQKSIFSVAHESATKLEDGVLLMPMRTLEDARDLATILRHRP